MAESDKIATLYENTREIATFTTKLDKNCYFLCRNEGNCHFTHTLWPNRMKIDTLNASRSRNTRIARDIGVNWQEHQAQHMSRANDIIDVSDVTSDITIPFKVMLNPSSGHKSFGQEHI